MSDFCTNTDAPKSSCCCGKPEAEAFQTVSPAWSGADRRGAVLCRLSNRFRMRYRVEPGLYAVGTPDGSSPVFVSANYRLSFNHLRRALLGIDGWILVLDTKGINVWCAAGKGTFGTGELVRRIAATGLASRVTIRRLIVPQLGASGISAHEVKKTTGFSVVYGPVRAADLPAFLARNNTATAAMRSVTFSLVDRTILTPMELFPALRKFLWIMLGSFLVMGVYPQGILFAPALEGALPVWLALLAAVVAGTIITPILLPFIPGRSFAIKGELTGSISLLPFLLYHGRIFGYGWPLPAAISLFGIAIASYLALNFTGCTTFTGMSGVKKEMRIALPAYGLLCATSAAFIVLFKLGEWGIL
jgi:hypothetical protein